MNYEITSNLNSRGDTLLSRNSMSPSVVNERERIMKHTQGKWSVTGQSENSRYITVKSDNGRTVARVPWNSEKEVEQDICTDNNDAILIAAAPKMLKRLKTIVNDFDRTGGVHSIHINFARQAIAKAEGE